MNNIEDLEEQIQVLLFNDYENEQLLEQIIKDIHRMKDLTDLVLYVNFAVLFGFLIFLFI